MTYLIVQIVFCLALAALIGLALGWLLRAMLGRPDRSLEQRAEDLQRLADGRMAEVHRISAEAEASEHRLRTQLSEYEAALATAQEETARVHAQAATVSEWKEKAAAAEIARNNAADETRRIQSALQASRTELEGRIAALDKELAAAHDTHRRESDKAREALASVQAETARDLSDARQRLASAETRAAQTASENAALMARMAVLEGEAAQAKAKADALARELSAASDQLNHLQRIESLAAAAVAGPMAPDDAPDDLTQISGINAALARQLRARGMTSYRDVARLTPERIAKLADSIDTDLADRIAREQWIEQAERLLKRKMGGRD